MKHFLLLLLIMPFGAHAHEHNHANVHFANDLRNILSGAKFHAAPFTLTAKVSFVGSFSNFSALVLEDMTGSIVAYLENAAAKAPPAPGDIINCSGHVSLDSLKRRHASIRQFKAVGRETPPTPVIANVSELRSGTFDYKFIRLCGTVYDARPSESAPKWALLTIVHKSDIVYASIPIIPTPDWSFENLIGADISLDGIYFPRGELCLGARKHLGRTLTAYSLSALCVTKPATTDLPNLPDISVLSNASAEEIPRFQRFRTSGTVLAVWENQALLTTTNATTIQLSFACKKLPAVDQRITAIGFPETDLFNINLTQAVWRRRSNEDQASAFRSPELTSVPLQIPPHKLPPYGKLVKTSGTVLSIPSSQETDNRKILIMAERQMIPVHLSPGVDFPADLATGCQVEVTGVCILESERWQPNLIYPKSTGFFLVMRSSRDIRIVAYPPWLTARRFFLLLGVLLAILVGSIFWNISLKRFATRKGRELFKEQLGHVKADLRTEERTRLAVELHDTLAQNLTGVSMEIEAANDLRGDAPKPMLDHLGIAAKALKSCRDELRNCLWDLRSQALEEPDMTKAVLKTLQPVVNDSRLAVRFNVPRARLSDNTAHALLRVIRELVVNAIRHGEATSVKVAGTIDGNMLLCSVTDDGCGFDPDSAPGVLQGHFGLQGIQERIDELGGTFEIASTPGKGTKATISIPIPHES